MAPSADGPEPRLKMLIGIASVRVISMVLVVGAHNVVAGLFYIDNPEVIENYYTYSIVHLLLNGNLIVQTFFILSGFLLTYNLLLFSENNQVGWSMFPKGIFLRWLRLTPTYALLMFFTVTFMRLLGSGPLWDIAVLDEVDDCKKYWWQHLLYINNYNDESQCFLHTWYLAADAQLYCLGLVAFIACRSSTSRKVVLSLLLLLGLVIPPLQTYLQDLDGVIIMSPEMILHFFTGNETFNQLYKKPHTNIFPYVIGLIMGYLAYHLQKIKFDMQKYRIYRFLAICLIPLSLAVMWSGCIFYRDAPKPSMLVRVAYAAFLKPVCICVIFLTLIFLLFKYIKPVNFFMESRVWTVLGRLSYCAYLVHLVLLRIVTGMRTVEFHLTTYDLSQQSLYLVFISFAAAVPLRLLVEQPFGQMVKVLLK